MLAQQAEAAALREEAARTASALEQTKEWSEAEVAKLQKQLDAEQAKTDSLQNQLVAAQQAEALQAQRTAEAVAKGESQEAARAAAEQALVSRLEGAEAEHARQLAAAERDWRREQQVR